MTKQDIFIQKHMPLIKRYSRSPRFKPDFVDPDDFQSELVLAIAEAFSDFRDKESATDCPYCDSKGCSTWIGWRARLTRTRAVRKRRKRLSESSDESLIHVPASGVTVQMRAQVLEILRAADKDEYEAAMSLMNGLTGKEVRDTLGITVAGRNYRIRRLAEKLGAAA